jgi:hypothetical protein
VGYEDINSILNESITAKENYEDFETYFNGGANFSEKVLITGYYPRTPYNQASWDQGSPTPLEIQEQFFDTVKNYPSTAWDYSIDLRETDNIGGASGQAANATYFADAVHLQALGYDEIANEYANLFARKYNVGNVETYASNEVVFNSPAGFGNNLTYYRGNIFKTEDIDNIESRAVSDQILSGDGYIEIDTINITESINSVSMTVYFSLGLSVQSAEYAGIFLSGTNLYARNNNALTGVIETYTSGSKYRIQRTGSTFELLKSTDYGQNYSSIYTYTVTSSADLYVGFSIKNTDVAIKSLKKSW